MGKEFSVTYEEKVLSVQKQKLIWKEIFWTRIKNSEKLKLMNRMNRRRRRRGSLLSATTLESDSFFGVVEFFERKNIFLIFKFNDTNVINVNFDLNFL